MPSSTLTTTPTTPAAGSAAPPPGLASRLPALLAALLGFFVITIDVSAVNIALPAVGDGLSGGMAGLQWVVDSYTLMFAALMLSAGALSDRIGARDAYGWGLGLFTAASLACGLAPAMGALIGARVVQGAAAAVMLPTSLALIRQAYADAALRARAIALWTAAGAVAMAAGPVLGGLLTSALSWRAVFFINLPVGALGVLLLTRVARSPRRPAPLDVGGQLAAVTGLAALTLAMIEGGHEGFARPLVLGAFAVAALAAAAFAAVEARSAQPLVPPALFRERTVSVPVAIGFAMNAAFYGTVFLLGLYFQQVRGLSPLEAGAAFVPMAAVTTVANLVSPRAAARFGAPATLVAGLAAGGVAFAALVAAGPHTPMALVVLLMVPVGVGGATVMPALTTLMLESVAAERAGTAAAVLNTSRQVGGAVAVALFGALAAGATAGDFVAGMRLSMLLGGGLVLAAALLAAVTLLPRRPRG